MPDVCVQEQSRALAKLNPLERLLHTLTQIVLGDRRMRIFFMLYALALHLLVLGILFELTVVRYVCVLLAFYSAAHAAPHGAAWAQECDARRSFTDFEDGPVVRAEPRVLSMRGRHLRRVGTEPFRRRHREILVQMQMQMQMQCSLEARCAMRAASHATPTRSASCAAVLCSEQRVRPAAPCEQRWPRL